MQKSFSKKASSQNSGNNSSSNSKLFQTNKSKQGQHQSNTQMPSSTGAIQKSRPLLKSGTQKKVVKNLMVEFDSLPQSKQDSKQFIRQHKKQDKKISKNSSKQQIKKSHQYESLENENKKFEVSKKSIIDSLNFPQLQTEEQSSQSPIQSTQKQMEVNQEIQPKEVNNFIKSKQLKSTKKKFQTQRQNKKQVAHLNPKDQIRTIQTVKKTTNINENDQNTLNLLTRQSKNQLLHDQMNNLSNYNPSYALPKSYILALTALQQSVLQKNNKIQALQKKLCHQQGLILNSQTKYNELLQSHQEKLSQLKEKQIQIKLLKNYLQQTQHKNQESLKEISKQFYRKSISKNININSASKSKDIDSTILMNQKKQNLSFEKFEKSFNNNSNSQSKSRSRSRGQNQNQITDHFRTFGNNSQNSQSNNGTLYQNGSDFVILQSAKEHQLKLLKQTAQLDKMQKQIQLNNEICLKANILSKQLQHQLQLQNQIMYQQQDQKRGKKFNFKQKNNNLRSSPKSKSRSQSHATNGFNKNKHNFTERKQQRGDKNDYQFNQSLTNYKKIQADRYYNKMRSNSQSQSNFQRKQQPEQAITKYNLLSSANQNQGSNLNNKIHQNRQIVSHMREVMRHEKELISLQYKMECIERKISESLSLKDQRDLLKNSNTSSTELKKYSRGISSSSSGIQFGIQELKRQYGYLKRQIQKKEIILSELRLKNNI